MSVPSNVCRPELMAPAGDWDCARAAVENGADAVYFGLQGGLNARARAANFHADELPELMTFLRTRGVRGYLTLNTLVFDDELEEVERRVQRIVAAGVDAVLVQDLGLLRLIARLCPELPLHASTQMTLSSAECIAEAASLGIRRVVLPRELPIEQIAAIHRETPLELEAFVHGALCLSYSGQCLASLALGGRSANRGECAQPCRLPHQVLVSDLPSPAGGGRQKMVGTWDRNGPDIVPYPLSPHDLAAYDRLPELIAAGVSALKIEGRLKPPEYVASVTRHYRTAIDAAYNSLGSPLLPGEIAEMETVFSRGFCHGWLDGNDPRSLVSGQNSDKRGTLLGSVRGVRGERIVVELVASVRRGIGVVFQPDQSETAEQGGRVYEVFQNGRSLEGDVSQGQVELAFRYGSIDRSKIRLGQQVWKTDDPQATRRLRKTYEGEHVQRRVPLDLVVEASVGSPLRVTASAATGVTCRLETPDALPEAAKHPLTSETLAEQFGRLGKTPYELRRLDATIVGRPMVPLSVLGTLRRELIERLNAAAAQPPARRLFEGSALDSLRLSDAPPRPQAAPRSSSTLGCGPHLHVLCRSMAQVRATSAFSQEERRPDVVSSILIDLRDLRQCAEAVQTIRAAGVQAWLATPRIHRPGESGAFKMLAACEPDGFLVRNLAGLAFFRRLGAPIAADFSLNAVNSLTLAWLCNSGAERVTAAYDLGPKRLLTLAAATPAGRLEVIVHGHAPLFHSEHCVFCRTLSSGKDKHTCGRPCERYAARLRDRLGVEHLLWADSQCRNTLFHGEAQDCSDLLHSLRQRGVRHFRVELLNERNADDVRRTLSSLRDLQEAS